MYTYNYKNISLFFTDKKNAFSKEMFYPCPSSVELLVQKQFGFLQEQGAITLITVNQTHGTDGLIIKTEQEALTYKPYSCQADFIVTNVPHIAIGVATADCLPIIFYDPINSVVAAAHAGWQGTVKSIAVKTVQEMHQHFGTQPENLQVFFGPSASVDAYEVSADFLENLKSASLLDTTPCGATRSGRMREKNRSLRVIPQHRDAQELYREVGAAQECFIHKNNKHYFNVPLYNQRLLEELGVSQFKYDYNACTITNHSFCSHRREKEHSLRQMTIAIIHKPL
jgi:YfiH family protein